MINISCLTSVFISSFLDNHRGYIQNLSPIKRSRNQNQWYDFDLQTSPSKLRRVVGFNIANHSMLQEHEASKTAVTLKNTKQNSNNDIIFNQQSTVRVTPTFDIDFDYKPINKSQKTEPSTQPAKKITLEELPTLQVNQKVNVTASISLGNENPKPVQLKSSSEMTTVKEDCVLEDETGTATIHIWDPLFKNIKTGTTYEFENLTVKHFQGITHLGTTPTTTFKEANQQLKPINGPALLANPEKEAKVESFKMINKLSIFITCQACKRKINEISQQNTLKCKNCGVRQRKMQCKRDASVQLLVHLDEKDIWLTAFTDVLESLFATHPTISLLSDSDTIEELLMDLQDIEFKCNVNRKVITEISSSSLSS